MTWTNIPFAHNSFVIWVLSDRHCIRRPRSMHGISDIEKWGIKIKNTKRGKCAGIHKKDLSRVLHYLLWQVFEWKRLSMTALAVTSRFLNFAAVSCWPLCDQKLNLFPIQFRQLIPLTWLSDDPQGHKKQKTLKTFVTAQMYLQLANKFKYKSKREFISVRSHSFVIEIIWNQVAKLSRYELMCNWRLPTEINSHQ